jgi:hypothetical protein
MLICSIALFQGLHNCVYGKPYHTPITGSRKKEREKGKRERAEEKMAQTLKSFDPWQSWRPSSRSWRTGTPSSDEHPSRSLRPKTSFVPNGPKWDRFTRQLVKHCSHEGAPFENRVAVRFHVGSCFVCVASTCERPLVSLGPHAVPTSCRITKTLCECGWAHTHTHTLLRCPFCGCRIPFMQKSRPRSSPLTRKDK